MVTRPLIAPRAHTSDHMVRQALARYIKICYARELYRRGNWIYNGAERRFIRDCGAPEPFTQAEQDCARQRFQDLGDLRQALKSEAH